MGSRGLLLSYFVSLIFFKRHHAEYRGPVLPLTRQDRNDKWLKQSVVPNKCSASCAPIRKPEVFRADGAAYSGRIDKSVHFAHADFWFPDQRLASSHFSGMTVGNVTPDNDGPPGLIPTTCSVAFKCVDDKWLEESVIPDKCSASCAPIQKPEVFRADGAAYSGRIDKSVRFAHADFWFPDQRSA